MLNILSKTGHLATMSDIHFFRYKRAHSINHAILIENPYIVEWRKKYIRDITRYKQAGRSIFYFDESYIHQHHCPQWVLHDTTIKSAADVCMSMF